MKVVRFVVSCSTQFNGAYVARLLGECSDMNEAAALARSVFDRLTLADPEVWCRIAIIDLDSADYSQAPFLLLTSPSQSTFPLLS